MTEEQKQKLMSSAIALAAVFAVYKFVKMPTVRAASLGVAGVIVGKNLPYVKTALV